MSNKFKNRGINKAYIFLGAIMLVVLVGTSIQYFKQNNINRFKSKTVGKIIEYKFINIKRYYIKYEYYVDSIAYTGRVGISSFRCNNGKEGCVGKTFTVYYSSKNPSYSKIDLGKYEKYKTTVEFFD